MDFTHLTSSQLHVMFVTRLLTAVVLGAVLGVERERKNKSAGIKTHILVTVAGCLLMFLSTYMFADFVNHPNARYDPARLAAQVGGGIGGFLAAGIFLRSDRFAISGYSTAGMLLLALIIGFAVGGGQFFVAIVTVLVVVFCMVIVDPLQKRLHKRQSRRLTYVSLDRPALLAEITTILGQHKLNILDVTIDEANGTATTAVEVAAPTHFDWGGLIKRLEEVPDVISVNVDEED